jgi:hypothetical protein
MKLKITHVAALAAISLVGSASAASIYTDSLIGSSTLLNNTTADTSSAFAGGTAGATWTAGVVNETPTGGVYSASVANAGADTGFLPITINSGFVYTLSATLNSSSPTGGWTALGFSDSAVNAEWHTGGDTKSAWALLVGNGAAGGNQFFGGSGTANGQAWAAVPAGAQTVTITLDTTGAAWTTFATIGSVNSATFAYTTNPTIRRLWPSGYRYHLNCDQLLALRSGSA